MSEPQHDPNEEWQYDRAMSPKTFERAIRALGMTQVEAGRYLGVSKRTMRRYIAGEANIPPAVVLLLRTLLNYGARPVAIPADSTGTKALKRGLLFSKESRIHGDICLVALQAHRTLALIAPTEAVTDRGSEAFNKSSLVRIWLRA